MISIYTLLTLKFTTVIKHIIRNEKEAKKLLKKYSIGQCSPQEAVIVEEWFLRICNTMPSEHAAEQETALKQAVWEEIQSKLSV
jgi:hypothetical protein